MAVSRPLVTIVMPARDAAPWIGAALASVADQTYPHEDLEIVVIDDGSVDGTAEIASDTLRQGDIGHRVLRRTASGGPAAARNGGWREGAGEWVQFLDADDLIAPQTGATQVQAASAAPADVAMVTSPWSSLIVKAGEWSSDDALVDPVIGPDPLMSVLRADNFIATGSQLFRRRWLDTVGGFDGRHQLIEDVDLLIRLVIAGGRLSRVPAAGPLFWYRRRDGSLSSGAGRAFVDAQIRNARLVEDHWRRMGELTPERRQFLADLYAAAVRRLAVDDPTGFEAIADHIERLQPAFVPSEPEAVRRLAKLVGYRRAERTAGRYRRLKALVKGASS